jgi:hypothetical protein
LRGRDESKYKLSINRKRPKEVSPMARLRRSSPAELSLYEVEEWTRKPPAGFLLLMMKSVAGRDNGRDPVLPIRGKTSKPSGPPGPGFFVGAGLTWPLAFKKQEKMTLAGLLA